MAELLVTRSSIVAEMSNIEEQMARIRRNYRGRMPNTEWDRLKSLGRHHQELGRMLGDLNATERKERQCTIEKAFMDAAFKVLTVDQVKKVWNRAHEMNPWLTTKDDISAAQIEKVYKTPKFVQETVESYDK